MMMSADGNYRTHTGHKPLHIPFRSSVKQRESTFQIENPISFQAVSLPSKCITVSNVYAYLDETHLAEVIEAINEIQDVEMIALGTPSQATAATQPKVNRAQQEAEARSRARQQERARVAADAAERARQERRLQQQSHSRASQIQPHHQRESSSSATNQHRPEKPSPQPQPASLPQPEPHLTPLPEQMHKPQPAPQPATVPKPGPLPQQIPKPNAQTHDQQPEQENPQQHQDNTTSTNFHSKEGPNILPLNREMQHTNDNMGHQNDQGSNEEDFLDQEAAVYVFASVQGRLPESVAFDLTFTANTVFSKIWLELQNAAFDHIRQSDGCFTKIQFFVDANPFHPTRLPKGSVSTPDIIRFMRKYLKDGGLDTASYDRRYEKNKSLIPSEFDTIGINPYAVLTDVAFSTFRIFIKKHTRIVCSKGSYTMLKNMGFPIANGHPGQTIILSNEGENAPEWKVIEARIPENKTKVTTECRWQAIIEDRPIYDIHKVKPTLSQIRAMKASPDTVISWLNEEVLTPISQRQKMGFGIDPQLKTPNYYDFSAQGVVSRVTQSVTLGGNHIFPSQYSFLPENAIDDNQEWTAADPNLQSLQEMYKAGVSENAIQTALDRMIFAKTKGLLQGSIRTNQVVPQTDGWIDENTTTQTEGNSIEGVRIRRQIFDTSTEEEEENEDDDMVWNPNSSLGDIQRQFESETIVTAQEEFLTSLKRSDLSRRIGPLYIYLQEPHLSQWPLGNFVMVLHPNKDGLWKQREELEVSIPKSLMQKSQWTMSISRQVSFAVAQKHQDFASINLPFGLFLNGRLLCHY